MIRRFTSALVALVILFPALAAAQPVFFDDFDGDALLPHWYQPPATRWEYTVSNSMLNVTDLFYPSNPHSPGNYVDLVALYEPQSDFRMDVWMGWDAGSSSLGLEITVGGPFSGSPILALFGYRFSPNYGPNPVIIAGASNLAVTMPAPAPGIHQFTISRIAGVSFEFHLDGSPFATFPDNYPGIPAGAVGLAFGGYLGQVVPMHIDRVQVVPAPGAWVAFLAFACFGTRRARR